MYEYIHMCENDRIQTIHHYRDIVRNTTIRCVNGNIYSAYYQLWYVYREESVKRALHLNSYIGRKYKRLVTLGYYRTFKHIGNITGSAQLFINACVSGCAALIFHILKKYTIYASERIVKEMLICRNRYVRKYMLFLILRHNITINYSNFFGEVCRKGNMVMFEQMCKKGNRNNLIGKVFYRANISKEDLEYVLVVACEYGYYNIVRYLLRLGVDPNSRLVRGSKPYAIDKAIRHARNLKLIKMLVRAGADTKEASLSCRNYNTGIVKYLLDNGMSMTSIYTSIESATRWGTFDQVKIFIPYMIANYGGILNRNSPQALNVTFDRYCLLSALEGKLDIIKYILSANLVPNCYIIIALENMIDRAKSNRRGQYKEIIRYCKRRHFINNSPKLRTSKNSSPCVRSMYYESFRTVANNILRTFYNIWALKRCVSIKRYNYTLSILRWNGAFIKNRYMNNHYFEIAKHEPIREDYDYQYPRTTDRVSIFHHLYKDVIKKGASTEQIQHLLNENLSSIYHSSRYRMIRYLIHHGADVNYHRQGLQSVIFHMSRIRIIKYLIAHGANVDGLIEALCKSNRVKAVRYLLTDYYDEYCFHREFLTELYESIVIKDQDTEIIDIVITNGADINVDCGEPLYAAITRGFIQHVRFLVQHGARVLPRHIAFAEHLQYPEIVKLLRGVYYTVRQDADKNICPL